MTVCGAWCVLFDVAAAESLTVDGGEGPADVSVLVSSVDACETVSIDVSGCFVCGSHVSVGDAVTAEAV